MQNAPTYQDLENRIKVLESKIIELYAPTKQEGISPWSTAFDQSDDLIFLFDKDNQLVNINSSAQHFLNHNKSELFGRSCYEVFVTDELKEICQHFDKANKQRTSFDLKIPSKNKHFKTDLLIFNNNDGFTEFTLLWLRDISIYQEQDDEQKEALSKLSGYIKNLPECIIFIDNSGKVIDINPAASVLLGITMEKAIGSGINDIFKIYSKYFHEDSESLIRHILKIGQASNFINNTILINQLGERLHILFSVVALNDQYGREEGIIITFIDITGKYKAEKSKRDQDERLHQMFEANKNQIINDSKKRIKLKLEQQSFDYQLIENIKLKDIIDTESIQRLQDEFSYIFQIASVIVDHEGNPLTNPSNFSNACKLFANNEVFSDKCIIFDSMLQSNLSTQVLERKKCDGCNIIIRRSPIITGGFEIANWVAGFVTIAAIDSGKTNGILKKLYQPEIDFRKALEINPLPDSEYIEKTTSFLWQICQEISSLGYDFIKLVREFTERQIMEHELKEAKTIAEESDKHKTAFLASMSHEIRTPMNAIIGFTDLLADPEFSEEEKAEFINLITNNGELLLRLIDDIIDIAKIEANVLQIETAECRVNVIINEVVMAAKDNLKKLGKDNIDIRVNLGNEIPGFSIRSDPFRLQQIFTNLVGNAQKFTTNGFIEIGYQLKTNQTLQGNETFLQFYVKDTGIGIAEDKINLIFDRFKQADEKVWKKFGGSGLGLTISKKLVNLLGGDIWVDSTVGKGSTFYFTIPYLPMSLTDVDNKIEEIDVKKLDLTGKTILIAEDIDSNFNLLRAILSRSNVQVIWAKDGKQAVDICRSRNIDLVLMDVKLPVLNGLLATERIKDMYKKLPVIAISAYASEEDKSKALEAGCIDYITKPIKKELLINLINKHIK